MGRPYWLAIPPSMDIWVVSRIWVWGSVLRRKTIHEKVMILDSANFLSTWPVSSCTLRAARTEHGESRRQQLCAHRLTHMHTHVYAMGTGVYGRGRTDLDRGWMSCWGHQAREVFKPHWKGNNGKKTVLARALHGKTAVCGSGCHRGVWGARGRGSAHPSTDRQPASLPHSAHCLEPLSVLVLPPSTKDRDRVVKPLEGKEPLPTEQWPLY